MLSGEYTEWCPWLVRELTARGCWTERTRAEIIRDHGECCSRVGAVGAKSTYGGSVAGVRGIDDDLKAVFRTAWEVDPKDVIDMAAARAPFIDQSQSLTLYMPWPTTAVLVGARPPLCR